MEIGGMWTLKHDTRSPKFYELLIKIGLKGNTALDLNNFYNQINMCLFAMNILLDDLLTDYQYVKIHSEFEEYLVLYCSHPSYYFKCTYLQLSWTIISGGIELLHLCKIFHGTSGLQGFQHPCSLNISLDNFIHISPFTFTSY